MVIFKLILKSITVMSLGRTYCSYHFTLGCYWKKCILKSGTADIIILETAVEMSSPTATWYNISHTAQPHNDKLGNFQLIKTPDISPSHMSYGKSVGTILWKENKTVNMGPHFIHVLQIGRVMFMAWFIPGKSKDHHGHSQAFRNMDVIYQKEKQDRRWTPTNPRPP